MPKMKTKSSAKKRFKVTKTGKVVVKQANTRHMLMNKPTKRKRQARGTTVLCAADARIVLRSFMPYNRRVKKARIVTANDNTTGGQA
jgi:large subunit ribosomal protein L35